MRGGDQGKGMVAPCCPVGCIFRSDLLLRLTALYDRLECWRCRGGRHIYRDNNKIVGAAIIKKRFENDEIKKQHNMNRYDHRIYLFSLC